MAKAENSSMDHELQKKSFLVIKFIASFVDSISKNCFKSGK